jgi:DNA-binding transcriptional LysR family regulator
MKIEHIRAFIAVAEELSFTRAAERLFIAQPPLSRQIQQLEQEIGTALFIRKTRSVALTDAGRFFLGHARYIIQSIEEAKLMTRRIGQTGKETKIGFATSLLYGYFSQIVYGMRQKHPDIHFVLEELDTFEQVRALKEGKIDVGFCREHVADPTILSIALRTENLVLACPEHHPLLRAGEAVSLADLEHETLIVAETQQKSGLGALVLEAFARLQLPLPRLIKVRDLQFALGLVSTGEGIAIVPSSYEKILLNVHYHPLRETHLGAPIVMNIRQGDHSPILADILATIYSLYDRDQIRYLKQETS